MEIHTSLKAEEILIIGPIAITNSMVMAWMTMILLVGFSMFATRTLRLVPSGAQLVLEYIVDFLLSMVMNSAGKTGRRLFPLIATIFVFIISANYMALLPGVGSISVPNPKAHAVAGNVSATKHADTGMPMAATDPGTFVAPPATAAKAEGKQPAHEAATIHLFRAANADLNMTLGMGLIAFIFIHWSGVRAHGTKGYLQELATPPFLTPVKLMIEGFVPVSLSMRLFGNVFGGEMLMTVMNWPVIAIPFLGMELLFGFIQAMIFSVLTLNFTILATTMMPGHGGHGAQHGGGDGHGGQTNGH